MDRNSELTIRGITLGKGIPKICVPIVEITADGILDAAAKAYKSAADLVEWRCDYYEGIHDRDQVMTLLQDLRTVLDDMPLLFTYRTKAEGGSAVEEIPAEEYRALNLLAAESGCVDIIDMELRMGKEMAEELITTAHKKNSCVLMSSHDFVETPPAEEMRHRYERMEAWGADILKLAVMPKHTEDLLTLLKVCDEVSAASAHPVVGISMGSIGLESRICGEAFGSAMTFGCLGKASAPGQMEAEQLAMVLKVIHEAH